MLKRELTANPSRKLGALLAKNALSHDQKANGSGRLRRSAVAGLEWRGDEAHGSARERAITNAIRVDHRNHQPLS